MEEFNNIELNDEELDNVAGGVRTATFERVTTEKGECIKVSTFVDEHEVLDGGGEHHRQSSGHRYIGEEFLQEAIKRYKERGYDIICKWEQ